MVLRSNNALNKFLSTETGDKRMNTKAATSIATTTRLGSDLLVIIPLSTRSAWTCAVACRVRSLHWK
jgi:hypothetical protein